MNKSVFLEMQRIILYLGEDPDYADLIKYLSNLHLKTKILYAPTLNQALSILKNQTVNLLISDYYMPGSNNLELKKILQQTLKIKNIPVIVLSSDSAMKTKQVFGLPTVKAIFNKSEILEVGKKEEFISTVKKLIK